MPRKPEPFFRILDIALMLKVSRRTVSNWIRNGKLRAHKFGKSKQAKVRISRAAFRRFLEAAEGGGR